MIFHCMDGLLLSKDTVSNKLAHIAAKIPICNECVKSAWHSTTRVYSNLAILSAWFTCRQVYLEGNASDYGKEDQRLCAFMWRSKIKFGKKTIPATDLSFRTQQPCCRPKLQWSFSCGRSCDSDLAFYLLPCNFLEHRQSESKSQLSHRQLNNEQVHVAIGV